MTNTRLAFKPTHASREYLEKLCQEMKEEKALDVRVTQREAFERLVEYAKLGEALWKEKHHIPMTRPLPPPLSLPLVQRK